MYEQEFEYFRNNQSELVKKYPGKMLVIVGENVEGAFDTPLEAKLYAQKHFKPGEFMIQVCKPGKRAYTVTVATPGLVESRA